MAVKATMPEASEAPDPKGGDVPIEAVALKDPAKRITSILLASSFFFVTGPAAILANRYIMADLGFAYPVSVSIMGTVVGIVVAAFLVHTGISPLQAKIDREFMLKNVFPVAACGAGSLFFGNYAYLYLSVSFIQMLKSLTPVLTLLLLAAYGLERPNRMVISSTVAMTLLTGIAAYGELHATVMGVIIMGLSIACESFRMLLMQKLFAGKVHFTVVEALYYIGPASLAFLIPLMWAVEARDIMRTEAYLVLLKNPFAVLLAGLSGGMVGFASNMVIKVTSSISLKVLSAARNAALVLFCATVLGEEVTIVQGICYFFTLIAFLVYSYYK